MNPSKNGPQVLELRVHGIKNTAPHVLLDCDVDAIEPVGDSDSLSGFWKEKAPATNASTRVEAYSWGKAARTSPASSFLKGVGRVVGQALWFLVVPFALANAAYWARKLPDGGASERPLAAGTGAGTVRLFALLLSLVFTTTFCTVAFGLLAVECFPVTKEQPTPTAMCKQLPEAFDFLTGWSRGQRLAMFTLLPIAAILAAFVTAKLATVRNLAPQRVEWNEEPATADGGREATDPFLASPGLWTRPHISSATGRVHISACLALICVLLLSDSLGALWPPDCQTASRMLSPECIQQMVPEVGQSGLAAPLLAIAFLVLLLAIAILVLLVSVIGVAFFSSETRAPANNEADEKWSKRLLISAVILMPVTVAPLVFVAMPEAVPNRAFAGTSVASLLLLTALTILAVSGLFMRRGRAFHSATIGGALISLVLILWALGMFDDWVLLIAAAITSVLLFFYYRLNIRWNILRKDRKAVLGGAKKEGWDGRGPGIFMFAAILVAYFLSSALVLGTRSLLEWPMKKELPAELKELWRGAGGSEVNLSESLQVPPVYAAIGGLLLFGILVALLGMLPACWWLISERGLSPMEPPRHQEPLPPQPPTYYNDIDVKPGPGAKEPGSQRQVMTYRRRRLSAAAQRGEAAFGLLTLLTWVAVVLAVAASALQNGKEANATGIRTFLKPYADLIQDDFAEWGVILAATLILGFMVKNAATSADDRPLAILWDIMCFLPNAAHPFGAPSYSNRVVPELARRIHDWLENPSSGGSSKVLLSAHSLGAVLAIAAIFHLKACKPEVDFTRVRLLTYGVQLRSYFGRFFPELFGPQVLGTVPTRGPSLFSIDPWKKARENEGTDPSLGRSTLVHLLGGVVPAGPTSSRISTSPVWKNIWRRTDYLGFPAYAHSETGNRIDKYADETEPRCSQFKVATHGNYTATTTYLEVREQMLSDWPLMLSWEQVKEIVNLELPVIDGLVESGELRAARFDGQKIWRIRADDVEAYIDKACAKNAESITLGQVPEAETPTDSK